MRASLRWIFITLDSVPSSTPFHSSLPMPLPLCPIALPHTVLHTPTPTHTPPTFWLLYPITHTHFITTMNIHMLLCALFVFLQDSVYLQVVACWTRCLQPPCHTTLPPYLPCPSHLTAASHCTFPLVATAGLGIHSFCTGYLLTLPVPFAAHPAHTPPPHRVHLTLRVWLSHYAFTPAFPWLPLTPLPRLRAFICCHTVLDVHCWCCHGLPTVLPVYTFTPSLGSCL